MSGMRLASEWDDGLGEQSAFAVSGEDSGDALAEDSGEGRG